MANILSRLDRAWLRRKARPSAPPERDRRLPVTIITGATEGIGRELAREFAAYGHNLLLVARSEARLTEAAVELKEQYPALVIGTLALDLTRPDAGELIASRIRESGWFAEYLVNNAGIGLAGPFHEMQREDVLALLDLNVRVLTDLMLRFLPDMLAQARGGILNVASLGGFVPGPYQAAYYASKAYVVSLTQAVAQEIEGQGVRLSVLAPGPVDTAFHARMRADKAIYANVAGKVSARRVARIGYANFMRWQRVIVPGVLPTLAATVAPFVPAWLSAPFIGFILKPRRFLGYKP